MNAIQGFSGALTLRRELFVSAGAIARISLVLMAGIGASAHNHSPAHHPQRLHPRFARLADAASHVPHGLAALSVLAPVAFSRALSSTENPSGDDLHRSGIAICGFPRTGSTYLKFAIERSLETPGAVWRTHDVLAVPQLEEAELLVVVPLRDPRSTAISWSLYNNDVPALSLMRSRIHSYSAWHRQIARYAVSPAVRFLSFDYFTTEPSQALSTKFRAAGIQPRHEHIAGQDVAARLGDDDAAHGVEPRHTHVPSDHRASLRADYEALLDDPKLASPLSSAQTLFEALLRRAPKPPAHHSHQADVHQNS
jgi:hypothetical protein